MPLDLKKSFFADDEGFVGRYRAWTTEAAVRLALFSGELFRVTHTLKSMVLMLGFEDLAETLSKTEDAIELRRIGEVRAGIERFLRGYERDKSDFFAKLAAGVPPPSARMFRFRSGAEERSVPSSDVAEVLFRPRLMKGPAGDGRKRRFYVYHRRKLVPLEGNQAESGAEWAIVLFKENKAGLYAVAATEVMVLSGNPVYNSKAA